MASSDNDCHQDDSANRRRAARNRKIEPPRKAPQTERGLTCRRDWQTLAQMKIQNVKSLPEVLTIEQVHQIIDGCRTQRMAARENLVM